MSSLLIVIIIVGDNDVYGDDIVCAECMIVEPYC